MTMKAYEVLSELGIEHCPECHCAVGNDWDYKPFSSHDIIVCPQCSEEIDVSWDKIGLST